ncbi:MAG TPA: PsiF family protein [Steroidobacteraceae bacterium]
MRITAALIFIAALGCGTAFATDNPRPTITATPSGASATPVKHTSLKACNKQADARKLTGPERATFVKSCRGGKPAA